jgi:TolB-like protein
MAEVAIPRRLFQEILRPQPPPHQHETFDSHAFDSNRREERAQNAWKNGQISPPDAARVRGMVAAVGTAHPTLRKGRQNVNIHANSRFIWGIPDKALFQGGQGLQYLFEGFVLDTDRRELRRGVEPVAVEPQVFDLLTFLIQNRERVVSKDEMIQAVWGGRIVSESALGARINAVRSAVGDNGEDQRVVKTFPRKGIRFIAPAHEQQTAAPTVVSQQVPTPSLVDKPSIAVLPFSNMSGDPEQDYFADGMAEEIITALSRCKWLFVIARNSSFAYKGRAIDIRQVGRELGVRYVLEGSVRRSGNRLRFVGQLIDATNGAHLWADRFDGELTDVFELQDSLTESVVAAIEPNLQRAEVERLKNKPAENLDAYDLLLRAQQLEHALTQESVDAALRCLERALVLAPAYHPPWHWPLIATQHATHRVGRKMLKRKRLRDFASRTVR